MYHYTDGGLRNVWLVNGYEVRKTPFGEAVAFHDGDGLTQAICQEKLDLRSACLWKLAWTRVILCTNRYATG